MQSSSDLIAIAVMILHLRPWSQDVCGHTEEIVVYGLVVDTKRNEERKTDDADGVQGLRPSAVTMR